MFLHNFLFHNYKSHRNGTFLSNSVNMQNTRVERRGEMGFVLKLFVTLQGIQRIMDGRINRSSTFDYANYFS